jgi:hypothetical protein
MALYDVALALLVVAIVVPLTIVMMRHRDKLLKNFDQNTMKILSTCHLVDGAKLCLVDVDGVTVLCALSRTGHISVQFMPASHGKVEIATVQS